MQSIVSSCYITYSLADDTVVTQRRSSALHISNGPFAFDVTHEFWGGNFKNGITSPS